MQRIIKWWLAYYYGFFCINFERQTITSQSAKLVYMLPSNASKPKKKLTYLMPFIY